MSSNSSEGQCTLGDGFKAVLLDVAGTTTSISFVKETLLPFASNNAEEFLKTNWDDEAVKGAVKALNTEKELALEEAVKLFKELTEASSDNVGVKTLQGLIYKKGYSSGDLKAHVFSDVAEALEQWTKTHKIAIYSTGSIDSQKLLFANTVNGDLTAHINNYYDQKIGSKTESESYKKVAEDLGFKPEEVIFVTDDVNEAKAAQTAKLEAVLIERDGNEKLDEESKKQFKTITAFSGVNFEASTKRKSEDEPEAPEERPAKLAKTEEKPAETPKEEEKPSETTEKPSESAEKPSETAEKPSETAEKPSETAEKPTEAESEPMEVDSAATETKEVEEKTVVVEEPKETKEEKTVVVVEEPAETKEDKKETTETPAEKASEGGVEITEIEETDAKTEKVDQPEVSKKTEEESVKPVVTEVEEKQETVELKETAVDEEKTEAEPVKEETEKKTSEDVKEKEKENKSELANGACETEQNGEVNGKAEEEAKTDEAEIKVKKLEETGETTSVSVEA